MQNLNEIISKIKSISQTKSNVLIAIDGVGGSGKTTLSQYIQKHFKNSAIVQLDDFYSPKLQGNNIERLKAEVLIPISNGLQAKYKIYEWKTNSYSDWILIPLNTVVIIEGVFSTDELIRKYYDLTIWLDFDQELGLKRGIERDIKSDGVDNTEKWKNIWMPAEKKYINTQHPQNYVDFVIEGNTVYK